MPALLPVVLTAAHLVLTSQEVPKLNVEPSCRAAAVGLIGRGNRSAEACVSDENQARATLTRQWSSFSRRERSRCQQLSTLGGPPSYVELLTCLQMAKAASKLPDKGGLMGPVARQQ
jgi:hypothetical protein